MQIALYKGRRAVNPSARLFDWLICWWTRSEYSHAELVLHPPHEVGGWCLCGSSSIRDHGVRTKVMRLDPAKWDLAEIDAPPEAQGYAAGWYEARLGMRYDWLGIFGFVLHRRWGRSRAFYCSETVACALGLPETRLTPGEIAKYALQRKRE